MVAKIALALSFAMFLIETFAMFLIEKMIETCVYSSSNASRSSNR